MPPRDRADQKRNYPKTMGDPETVLRALALHLRREVVGLRQAREGLVAPANLSPPHDLPAARGLRAGEYDYPPVQGSGAFDLVLAHDSGEADRDATTS